MRCLLLKNRSRKIIGVGFICFSILRPEGPAVNRPDRKVGIRLPLAMSAEGAALREIA